jgi:glycosidase
VSTSVFSPEVQAAFDAALTPVAKVVQVGGRNVTIQVPFPSPEDWRDQWIYFLMVDRFNNPTAQPKSLAQSIPFDGVFGGFQGGTLDGVRAQLDYIKALGAGAIWLSPVLKNCQYEEGTFHGYGIQNYLRVEPRFCADPKAAKANPALADDQLRRLVDEAHARGLYIILDIVLNHAGNVFGYVFNGQNNASKAPFRGQPYPTIMWHDEHGKPSFADIGKAPANLPDDAAVWPVELHSNDFFRRQGQGADKPRAHGDFDSLKQLVSESLDVDRVLIRAYQYSIAKFDVDGFRIDTFKVPDPNFGKVFCNSMREFALSIGKKNFFTFGEITTGEKTLAQFIGRDTRVDSDEPIGIDAALDFDLEGNLNKVIKHAAQGRTDPGVLVDMYQRRKQAERTILTTHGEASNFFVTFLDNHDGHARFFFQDATNPHRWDDQLTLALGCLFGLQGIPCVYYGTEQGLHGIGNSDSNVREALWGKPDAFDRTHAFYTALKAIAAVHAAQPALRYGRQYFRQISSDEEFAIPAVPGGVIAFSRILDAQEVMIVANPLEKSGFKGQVIVDAVLNATPGSFRVLFSNKSNATPPGLLVTKAKGSVQIHELDGRQTDGPVRVLPITLQPLEIQILRR